MNLSALAASQYLVEYGACFTTICLNPSKEIVILSKSCLYLLLKGLLIEVCAVQLGRAIFNHLKVYKGPDHPHEAQKPIELPIRDKRIQKQR